MTTQDLQNLERSVWQRKHFRIRVFPLPGPRASRRTLCLQALLSRSPARSARILTNRVCFRSRSRNFAGPVRWPSPGHGCHATYRGGEDAAVRQRRGGQRVGDGGARVGERGEERVPEPPEGHQRGAAIATRNGRIIAIPNENDEANLSAAEETYRNAHRSAAVVLSIVEPLDALTQLE